ncbi:phospholipase A [Alteromonas sp. MYP5]|uniref:Phospholipase A1 n=2 Tax=Alteromonas ponticola TaxID=2720613 RepID=A0ABX1QXZ4_9ALTE|nr:phospholipase A [Alteromonas ponticola]
MLRADQKVEQANAAKQADVLLGGISSRIVNERRTEFDPYVITPHKLNYILPAWVSDNINRQAYRSLEGYEENLEDIETKFQLSLKVPLNTGPLFIEGDGLYLGFTLEAWWQTYANNISKPFRETNYQPELFYIAPLPWQLMGGNTGFIVGVEHQSNGRGELFSRSWNRVYTHFLFEKENFALSLKPWVRLSEDEKTSPLDSDGDDNPDIEDYLGHFELTMVYRWDALELSLRGRQNQHTHKGALEMGLTFPLWGKLRGYATGFTGYGESLIDYNYKQTRIGFGVSLNNVL